jgi:hypothetical protein
MKPTVTPLTARLLTPLENPWMRQEFDGNLRLTDGRTTRLYDVTNWSITESTEE